MGLHRIGFAVVVFAVAACSPHERGGRVEQLEAAAPPGVHADKRCWKDGVVKVFHNKSIDPKLLGVADIAGNAADAQAAFADAVELWKTKIAASDKIKDVLKLTYEGDTSKYAGDAQGQAKREDNERDDEWAFRVRYNPDNDHKHSGDGQNTAATGHKHPDGKPARDGDGWVWNDDTAVASTIDIEKRLAETRLVQDGDKKITEGDITWFTHVSTSDTKAKLIVWNYKKDADIAPRFNYRPVMVHEIGHLLGLDHCTAGDSCEVMVATIAAGDDPEIKDGEMAALEYLYGPDGPCAPPPPDGPPPDAPDTDGGMPDAEMPDAPWPDATPDAPMIDAAWPDAPMVDAPWPDAPWPDAPTPDAPWLDAPMIDAAWPDAPMADAAWPDAPTPDAPWPDAPWLGSGAPI